MPAPLAVFVCRPPAGWGTDTLLAEAAQLFAGATPAPGEWAVVRPAVGRPYFARRPDVCFSVTHSGAYWLCAFAYGPLGVDLQQETPVRVQELAERFFSPQEAAYLLRHPEAFFSVWSGKESYVKYTGSGIDDGFGAFSVVEKGALTGLVQGACLQWVPFCPGYRLCVCTPRPVRVVLRQFWVPGQTKENILD